MLAMHPNPLGLDQRTISPPPGDNILSGSGVFYPVEGQTALEDLTELEDFLASYDRYDIAAVAAVVRAGRRPIRDEPTLPEVPNPTVEWPYGWHSLRPCQEAPRTF